MKEQLRYSNDKELGRKGMGGGNTSFERTLNVDMVNVWQVARTRKGLPEPPKGVTERHWAILLLEVKPKCEVSLSNYHGNELLILTGGSPVARRKYPGRRLTGPS